MLSLFNEEMQMLKAMNDELQNWDQPIRACDDAMNM